MKKKRLSPCRANRLLNRIKSKMSANAQCIRIPLVLLLFCFLSSFPQVVQSGFFGGFVTSGVDTLENSYDPKAGSHGEYTVRVRVCPPLYLFTSWVGQDQIQSYMNERFAELREKFHQQYDENNKGLGTIMITERTSGGNPTHQASGFWWWRRDANLANRCSISTLVYNVKEYSLAELSKDGTIKPSAIQRALIKERTLKVGVRDYYPKLSWADCTHCVFGAGWEGADIQFAEKIAQRWGLTLEIIDIGRNSLDRYEAIQNGDVDMVISSISKTPSRVNDWSEASWSKPYLKTGLTVGTFDYGTAYLLQDTKKQKENSEGAPNVTLSDLNSSDIRVHVAKNTTASEFVKSKLTKTTMVVYDSSADIPDGLKSQATENDEKAKMATQLKTENTDPLDIAQQLQPTLDIFVTDLLIARGWSEAVTIPIEKNHLIPGYDNDEYAVITSNKQSGALATMVDIVIDEHNNANGDSGQGASLQTMYYEKVGLGHLNITKEE